MIGLVAVLLLKEFADVGGTDGFVSFAREFGAKDKISLFQSHGDRDHQLITSLGGGDQSHRSPPCYFTVTEALPVFMATPIAIMASRLSFIRFFRLAAVERSVLST